MKQTLIKENKAQNFVQNSIHDHLQVLEQKLADHKDLALAGLLSSGLAMTMSSVTLLKMSDSPTWMVFAGLSVLLLGVAGHQALVKIPELQQETLTARQAVALQEKELREEASPHLAKKPSFR